MILNPFYLKTFGLFIFLAALFVVVYTILVYAHEFDRRRFRDDDDNDNSQPPLP